jgi:hypothetical protein
MSGRIISCVAALMVSLAAASGYAQTILFANMTNEAENPDAVPTLQNGQPRPASFGNAVFVLNGAQTAMTMEATVINIDFTGSQSPDPNDNLVNAHIHAGPNVTPETNAGVVWGFIGAPFNDTTPTDTVVTPFATGVGGIVRSKWDAPEGNSTTLTAQLANILAGRSYINFHTVQFGGGEVRGNIAVVPEPTSALLLVAGGAMLALRRRTRA